MSDSATNIQSTSHDSIEDARTALKLYSRYLELKAEGMEHVRLTIKGLYEAGRRLGWKIRDETGGDTATG